ncbi:thiopurine S-methyltransferase [Castellaniella sp.]|uniref:thiopurine S-methyltransferase n=1 Tax=Castellaniella sp. TaxID=1955812 RepID=UPI002AFF89D1|nr:thiopurine S-methyltransferase [Castellaniella sp.]
MDTNFWLQRWQNGQTGFHQDRVMPLLQKHWSSLGLAADAPVLVPLAGKSLDVAWLAGQGHPVLAVELSPLAVTQFFADQGLTPTVHETPQGRWYQAGNIRYLCGDIFNLSTAQLAEFQGCYDRAALIALPPDLRQRYMDHVYGHLPVACQTLLLTLDYPQEQMDGPPFAVPDTEVQQCFHPLWQIQQLESRDVLAHEPKFAARGLSRMETTVYHLTKT